MKTVKIGQPVSPCDIISNETKLMRKVLISYGGGMGGMSKVHYAQKVITENDKVLRIVDLDGRDIKIGRAFIVEEEEVKVVILKTDVTRHANYHTATCQESILTEFFDIKNNDFVLLNQYTGKDRTDNDCELIKKISEIK